MINWYYIIVIKVIYKFSIKPFLERGKMLLHVLF